MSSFKADSFKHAPQTYRREFEGILIGIIRCYKLILKNKIRIPNNENEIRDIFLKNYLKKQDIKKQLNLLDYRFDRETLEDNSNGRVDIRILSKNDFENDDAYYVIECKRLDNENLNGISGLNAEYVKNGILRFTTGRYSTYYGLSGMIGFIVKPLDISNNIININTLLKKPEFSDANTITKLKSFNFIQNFNQSYLSIHKPNNKPNIGIYHLMFDFSKNLGDSDT